MKNKITRIIKECQNLISHLYMDINIIVCEKISGQESNYGSYVLFRTRLNCTFSLRILISSRKWFCLFQIEQNCPQTIMCFFCSFSANPHFPLKKH